MKAAPLERKLAAIDVKLGTRYETQSGLQMMQPRIYGAYDEPAGARIAAIVMHPVSNFMSHYLIAPLAARGITTMGLNSRYAGNDNVLIMERVIADLGAGVRWLRDRGYAKVLLIGNSGGAALASFYQAQAERLTIDATPAGDPIALEPGDLRPADGIALCAAHPGRSHTFSEWLDPSILDEHDPLGADPSLDLFDPRNGPPYDALFLEQFHEAQRARRERLDARVKHRLRMLRADPSLPGDEAFVVFRTHADPRMLDLSLDANDRAAGSLWGDPRALNYAANAFGRFTTLTSYMSQWSAASNADGATNLARTSVPVLLLDYTADQSAFPSTRERWVAAANGRAQVHLIVGGDHYLTGRPDLVAQVADLIAGFAERL